MADDTEELQDEEAPVVDTSQAAEEQPDEPMVQQPLQPPLAPTAPAPVAPPNAVVNPAQAPTQPPMVPFTIGSRDPLTGEMRTVTGFGRRATPPSPDAAFWNRLRSRTANLPLAQTEAAVSAALRYQGQRQYQRDLASGMAPAEALARSAPLIFNAPRQSSLGQAAQFLRATTPTKKYHQVGGVLYRQNPDGTVTAVTGPAAPKYHQAGGVIYRETPGGGLEAAAGSANQKPNALDEQEYRSYLTELRKIESDLNEPGITGGQQAALARRGRAINAKLDEIRARYSQTTGPARPRNTTARSGTSGRRIHVRHPNGKYGSIPEEQLEAAKAAGYTEVP